MAKLDQVFGVSSRPLLSYIEREEVDVRLREAITSDKQVVVYGSSKQGKTALVTRHLPYDKNIHVSLTPKMTLRDVYRTVLSSEGIDLVRSTTKSRDVELNVGADTKVHARIPLLGGAGAGVSGGAKRKSSAARSYEAVPINLELPQSIARLLAKVGSRKWIILDNFHYLSDRTQRDFAFDLRSFQELGVRFAILGVWREKNRMAQFNGDLLDRIVEIPVEPWTSSDFARVAKRGGEQLRINIRSEFVYAAGRASFGSIAVFQELMKESCKHAGIDDDVHEPMTLMDEDHLRHAIARKADDYGARHRRALTDLASSQSRRKDVATQLYLPYYLVKAVLLDGYDGIANGLTKADLQATLRRIHPLGSELPAEEVNALFQKLTRLQAAKGISPPILHYDHPNRLLQIVDSTFHFFVKHVDCRELIEAIPAPRDVQVT